MHTEQMLESTFAFPAALAWVTELNNRSYKIGIRSVCLGHVKLSALRNSAKRVSKRTSAQLNKNHLFVGNAGKPHY